MNGMNTLAVSSDNRIKSVSFKKDMIVVGLIDGRIISVPLLFYPRLYNATQTELNDWVICGGGFGIHWNLLDEDLSSEGLLRGAPAPNRERILA